MECVRATRQMPREKCEALKAGFRASMERGLAGEESDLKMLPSFVTALPTGAEAGTVYALDLGGTNFRVMRVVFAGAGAPAQTAFKAFALQQTHMTGSGTADLFPFLAACIRETVAELEGGLPPPDAPLPLGFTFSFPTTQTALNRGTLLCWTKGFCAADCVGRDVVALLQEALNALGVHVEVKALANDTVGTLMALRRTEPACCVGVIFGTGSNGCYVEDMGKLAKWTGGAVASGVQCVNIEWGNFGELAASRRLLPRTPCDDELDEASLNKGKQLLEKLVGGMYIGELVCRFFNAAADAGEVLRGRSQRLLPATVTTEVASLIEGGDVAAVEGIMRDVLGVSAPAHADAEALQAIACAVSSRGARVSACAIGAILEHTQRLGTRTAVAVDGSVFTKYTAFQARMEACLRAMYGADAALVELLPSADGSGIGAAVIAATA